MRVHIRVHKDYKHSIEAVKDQCEAIGLKNASSLPRVGRIIGDIDFKSLPRLKDVWGVEKIEKK